MIRVKLDQDVVGLTALLEQRSGARVKDCFKEQETIYFVVATGEAGKAIGRNGVHVQQLQQQLQKKIKVIEYHDSPAEFVRNLIAPLRVEEVREEGELLLLQDHNKKTKGLLIGREGKNLRILNRAVQRFFPKEVKVI
ncbi:MAG: NusA-like transcription termination signal-binding factor [Nanoarchaeota archaeon]